MDLLQYKYNGTSDFRDLHTWHATSLLGLHCCAVIGPNLFSACTCNLLSLSLQLLFNLSFAANTLCTNEYSLLRHTRAAI